MLSFYNEDLLAPHPTPKLEDFHLLIVCNCLFNIFVATVHISRPPPLQPETCHSVLTGMHLFLFSAWYLEIRNVIHNRCISKMQISLHTHKWVPCSNLETKFWNIHIKDLHLCYSTRLSTTNRAFQIDLNRLSLCMSINAPTRNRCHIQNAYRGSTVTSFSTLAIQLLFMLNSHLYCIKGKVFGDNTTDSKIQLWHNQTAIMTIN
jgi:hypothetical protein